MDDEDSSDPEDVADTSLFNAVYTDLLATEQVAYMLLCRLVFPAHPSPFRPDKARKPSR